jgi:L-fuconate dehydratase
MTHIVEVEVADLRFPTSRTLDGSDAMNPDPDYSAAYLVVRTDESNGTGPAHEGHGFVFTIGEGNDIQVAAIERLAQYVVGRDVDELATAMGSFAKEICGISPWRWLGPEKGVAHMAAGAVVNAVWDLHARRAGLPLWRLLAAMSPEQLVELVDFRYISDVLTRERALEILRAAEPGRAERAARLEAEGYPAYTTSPGWLGYTDGKLARLCREAVDDGFGLVKLKVGANPDDDRRRLQIAREALDGRAALAIDANQRWGVAEAIENVKALAAFDPVWIEEPTSPDDILGHASIASAVAPIKVATGEHVHNRVMFKQFLQANALQILQLDATRVGGVNENVAILLLAAEFGVPVCPHAGGVGLCELVQHLSMFDFVAVSGSAEGRVVEYVDHLHEHFATPVVLREGRYLAPTAPGSGAEIRPESRAEHSFPDGPVWRSAG